MSGRRIAAVGALVIGLAALVLALIVAVQEFPQGLVVLGLVCIRSGRLAGSGGAAWSGPSAFRWAQSRSRRQSCCSSTSAWSRSP